MKWRRGNSFLSEVCQKTDTDCPWYHLILHYKSLPKTHLCSFTLYSCRLITDFDLQIIISTRLQTTHTKIDQFFKYCIKLYVNSKSLILMFVVPIGVQVHRRGFFFLLVTLMYALSWKKKTNTDKCYINLTDF